VLNSACEHALLLLHRARYGCGPSAAFAPRILVQRVSPCLALPRLDLLHFNVAS